MNTTIDKTILERVKVWLDGNYDSETKKEIKELIQNNPAEIIESFYRDLEFGTGGLRGIMGAGTNRMNKYTVGMATQGLANYLKKMFVDEKQIKIAIAFDCRNNSKYFARISAEVLSANGIKVYLFDALRPTPELSFAIRYLKCHSGIVITASHNPKEYNGYKVYWNDGAQLINPHDINVIKEAKNIKNIDDVKFEGNENLIEIIGEEIDKEYLKAVKTISLSENIIEKHKDLKIVYTPIHGTGVELVPRSLRNFGFENIINIPEQDVVDGNFPTVKSPNPEEPAAMQLAIKKAKSVDANLVMATDPDSDRVGIAVKNLNGDFVLLNGNQTAALIFYYLLRRWKEKGKLKGNEYVIKTIVTTELLSDIALGFGVDYFDTLTGFKFIADVIRKYEDEKTYIGGGEESYGYLIGDFVRDKDAVTACSLIAEIAAWTAEQGKTIYEILIDIYIEFGFYKEQLLSVVRKGKSGAEEIKKMMEDYRSNPPKKINDSDVICIKDFLTQKERNFKDGYEKSINLPISNVLQFFLEDGSKISVRPSGTEPKIKYYFSVKNKLENKNLFEDMNIALDRKIADIISSMNLS